MEIIGIICEYNPFHNGHLYQIKKIKELYPDSLIILVLNGYFLERGLISIESKEEKTRLALLYGIDLVVELPFVFGTNSADIFAENSLEILNHLGITRLIFGSESNDINKLTKISKEQLSSKFNKKVKEYLDEGINYPTALNKAASISVKDPNDLLGISYIKAILKNKYNIKYELIKRTNDYHDTKSNDEIISASNIRLKIKEDKEISKYIPQGKINYINEELFFNLLKYKIITDHDLSIYLTVDEGIHYRLKKVINDVNSLDELINSIKTKRYTYNRLMRMFIHILIGYKKEDKDLLKNVEYIRILGFNKKGQTYLGKIKKKVSIPILTKVSKLDFITKQYEDKAASLYKMLTNDDVLKFESKNQPLKK